MRTKRPLGVNVVLAYYVNLIVLLSLRLLGDLALHLYRFIEERYVPDIVFGLLSVLAVIGLAKMRPWGRILAIILSGVAATSLIALYSVEVALGLWTLLPHGVRPTAEILLNLAFAIYTLGYLLRPKARDSFRPAGKSPAILQG